MSKELAVRRNLRDCNGLEINGDLLRVVGYSVPDKFLDEHSEKLLGKPLWGVVERILRSKHVNPDSNYIFIQMGNLKSRADLEESINYVERLMDIGRRESFPIHRWAGIAIEDEVAKV